jgi:hypothetical protein
MSFKAANLILFFFLQVINPLQAQYAYKITFWAYNGGAVLKEPKSVFYLELYNSDSLLIEKRSAFSKDDSYSTTIFEYNEKKQKISESEFYFINRLSVRRHYEYDSNGLLHSMTYRTRNKKGDTIQIKELYFYSGSGQLIKRSQTASKYHQPEIWTYKYESADNTRKVTELKSRNGKKKPLKKVIIYNERGLIISVKEKGYGAEYRYEYGQNGEWVTKKVCENQGKLTPWICRGEYRKTIVNNSVQ